MNPTMKKKSEAGFSLVELIIAVGVMVVVTAAVSTLMRDTMKVSTAAFEITDSQENLRIAQEYINRDLMNAGDGLKSLSTIRVPQNFVTNYLSLNPVIDEEMPAGTINLGILTSDNQVPGTTNVTGSSPATTILDTSDRQTILEIDPSFTPIALAATPTPAISSSGSTITVSAADIGKFAVGEIYFVTSSLGGTFVTITQKNTGTCLLTFATGDTYGLNLTGLGGHLMKSQRRINHLVDENANNSLLTRKAPNASSLDQRRRLRDSIIAEHVLNVQFNYSLNITDANGNPPSLSER